MISPLTLLLTSCGGAVLTESASSWGKEYKCVRQKLMVATIFFFEKVAQAMPTGDRHSEVFWHWGAGFEGGIEVEYHNAEIVWRLTTPTPIQGLAGYARRLARLMQRYLSRGSYSHIVEVFCVFNSKTIKEAGHNYLMSQMR